MATAIATQTTQLHVGLFVTDLQKAVNFYRLLFASEPAKNYLDYVEFSLDNPALVLVLSPQAHAPGGTLNHVGLRLPDREALARMETRLVEAGFSMQKQDGVACCYAKQNKLWVTDPDHNLWEIYNLDEDIDHHGFEDVKGIKAAAAGQQQVVFEYRLPEPLPEKIDHADGTVDEVRLCGAFNADMPVEARQQLIAEAFRVLKPGGKLVAQGLVSAEPFPGKPDLPGLASKIQRVPVESEPLDLLREGGFAQLFYDELADIHCFQVDGVELRKLRITGLKPTASLERRGDVLYKGPLDEVRDDAGNTFRRGQKVAATTATWDSLLSGPAAEQFVFFE